MSDGSTFDLGNLDVNVGIGVDPSLYSESMNLGGGLTRGE